MTDGEAAVFDEWQKAMMIWREDRKSQSKSTTVKSGVKHVLVEGNVGCGKTHMIRWFERVHGDSVQVNSFTGLSVNVLFLHFSVVVRTGGHVA